MLSPSSSTTPAFGFSSRARARSSVDLPHAFAPTMQVILPVGIVDGQIAGDLDLVVGEGQVLGGQRVVREIVPSIGQPPRPILLARASSHTR